MNPKVRDFGNKFFNHQIFDISIKYLIIGFQAPSYFFNFFSTLTQLRNRSQVFVILTNLLKNLVDISIHIVTGCAVFIS